MKPIESWIQRCISVFFPKLSTFLFHQARRSSVKLDIYRKFTNALAISVIASVAWIGYEVYIYFSNTSTVNILSIKEQC